MRVIGAQEHAVAEDRHAAIDATARVAREALRTRTAIMPDLAAGVRVEGIHFVDGTGVHDTLDHDGCAFQTRP